MLKHPVYGEVGGEVRDRLSNGVSGDQNARLGLQLTELVQRQQVRLAVDALGICLEKVLQNFENEKK